MSSAADGQDGQTAAKEVTPAAAAAAGERNLGDSCASTDAATYHSQKDSPEPPSPTRSGFSEEQVGASAMAAAVEAGVTLTSFEDVAGADAMRAAVEAGVVLQPAAPEQASPGEAAAGGFRRRRYSEDGSGTSAANAAAAAAATAAAAEEAMLPTESTAPARAAEGGATHRPRNGGYPETSRCPDPEQEESEDAAEEVVLQRNQVADDTSDDDGEYEGEDEPVGELGSGRARGSVTAEILKDGAVNVVRSISHFASGFTSTITHLTSTAPAHPRHADDSNESADEQGEEKQAEVPAAPNGLSLRQEGHDEEEGDRKMPITNLASLRVVGSTITLEGLIGEARKPFGQLMMETPDAAGLLNEVQVDRRGSSASDEARSPLLSAIVRARLIGDVIGCCEAVASELSPSEAKLWNAFVAIDSGLQATLVVSEMNFRQVLGGLASSPEVLEHWVSSLMARSADAPELDFADLLDWYTSERHVGETWTFQSSLKMGFANLFSTGTSTPSAPPRLTPERISELRERCIQAEPLRLAEAAAAYRRSMVLTACWRCEQHLRDVLAPVVETPNHGDGIHGRPPGPVAALLVVLRAIHAELAPSERVIWEMLGSKDSNFDGAMVKAEVLAAIGEFFVYSLGRESDATEDEFEELQRLRADCQRQSVDGLFAEGDRRTVTLADVLRWWWDMPEEYRVAAGLAVPAVLLRRGIQRQPEEMFKTPLRRVAADASLAKHALRGNVRVFAELRALCVRRAIEGFHGCTPTDTRTTTTSDYGDRSMVDPDEEDEDADLLELDDCDEQEAQSSATAAPSSAPAAST
eukprot:TRINITY_DN74542_c0_g1_i1.p1 TRINITY_DN74542_c0_g1~~TRINITY_DN74542_c0_g1_i1.p1  ORF type:complete len:809 (+),score=207.71 TRINITY_DN74542_c0_g1_i1:88-2514(+)